MSVRSIVIVSGLLLLAACNTDNPLAGSNAPVSSGTLKIETVEFQRNGGPQCPGTPGVTPDNQQCASVRISYPKVQDPGNPAVAETINQFIRTQLLEYGEDEQGKQPATLDELANTFIGEYLQDPVGAWEMERHIAVAFGTEQLLTLSYSESGYTGGAHPFSGQRHFVLATGNGQQLTLSDLLASGYESQLNVAGEKAFRQAREIAPDANLESEGFWFENNAFKVNTNFGVMADGLLFTFNPYEVAPYALGPTDFTVHYEDIRSLISTSSPLAALAK